MATKKRTKADAIAAQRARLRDQLPEEERAAYDARVAAAEAGEKLRKIVPSAPPAPEIKTRKKY